MKRMITAATLTAAMVLATAPAALADVPANAGEPTCSQFFTNHGDHVTGDYVEPNGSAGGGSPAHFGPHGVSAGASFCLDQAQAPELLGDPGRFAD